MNRILLQLSNTLLTHRYYIEEAGLLNGKMGVSLFLYHCSQILDSKVYSDLADKYVGDVYNIMCNQTVLPVGFENGLPGLGWGMEYLARKKFIDADMDEALSDIDSLIFEKNVPFDRYREMEIPLFEKGLYFLNRNKPGISKRYPDKRSILGEMAKSCLPSINDLSVQYPWILLFSYIYFFVEAEKQSALTVNNHTKERLCKRVEHLAYCCGDDTKKVYILHRFLDDNSLFFTKEFIDKIKAMSGVLYLKDDQCVDFLVYTSWVNLLFFRSKGDSVQANCINKLKQGKQIESWIVCPDKRKLSLITGISGIGLSMIQNNMCD